MGKLAAPARPRLTSLNHSFTLDPMLVREILLHEITHALLGKHEGDPHGEEFRAKLRDIGGQYGRATPPQRDLPSA